MDKFFDNEFTDSIKGELKRRFYSPLYGTYITSWCIFHWEFLYTALFVSEDKIWLSTGLLKNQYLADKYFNFYNIQFYILQLLPVAITYIIIWHFPKWISIPAFKKHLDVKSKQAELVISTEKKLEKLKVEELKLTSERVKQEGKIREAKKKVAKIDPTVIYSEDYESFKSSIFFSNFQFIIDSIYKHKGEITSYNYTGTKIFDIPRDILVFAHTNDLVVIDKEKNKIELTDKGKYFIKRFSEEGQASF